MDASGWPGWLHSIRLVFAFAVTALFGIHAFYQHRQESVEAVSSRKWMFWIYSVVFLAAAVFNFLQLCVTLAFGAYEKASFHIGYTTLLLVLSYLALLGGVSRRAS